MRVCFFIASFADGGAQRQSIFLLNEFQRRDDVEVFLIYLRPGIHDELLKHERITSIRIPVKSYYDPRIPFLLAKTLRQIRPDILVTWLHNCDIPGMFVRRAHKGMRWIMTERNSHYPLRDPRFRARRFVARFADAIIANSEKGSAYWSDVLPIERRFVIPNIIHPVETDTPPTEAIVVTIGRIEPQKNVDTVIAAFKLLSRSHPEYRFRIIGAGSGEAEVQRSIADHPQIAFLGFRKDVPGQIHQASLVVTMSHREGLPNVMMEAIAGDRLVVASDIPEHREILGADYPFLVGDRENAEMVADMIVKAMASRNDTSVLAHARERLSEMGAEEIAGRYLTVFKQVLQF